MRFTEAEKEAMRQTPEYKHYRQTLAQYMVGLSAASFLAGWLLRSLF